MPRSGSTALKPNPKRPVLSDLRSKVIGTNALILDLTQQVSALVQAQHAMIAALTDLVTKIAHPPQMQGPYDRLAAAPPHLTRAEKEMLVRQTALQRSTQRPTATGDTIIGAEDSAGPVKNRVPRGTRATSEALTEDYLAKLDDIARSEDEGEPADEPDFIERAGSFDADMAAELASYTDEDEQIPPPPDDAEQDDLWSRRLSLHRQMRMWKPEWGAMPGQSGCAVPPHLLNGRG